MIYVLSGLLHLVWSSPGACDVVFFSFQVQLLYNVGLVSAVQQCESATCIRLSYLLSLPAPVPPLLVITEHRAELPVLDSSFPLAVYFTKTVVCICQCHSVQIPSPWCMGHLTRPVTFPILSDVSELQLPHEILITVWTSKVIRTSLRRVFSQWNWSFWSHSGWTLSFPNTRDSQRTQLTITYDCGRYWCSGCLLQVFP